MPAEILLAAVCAAALAYPFALYPLILRTLPRLEPPVADLPAGPLYHGIDVIFSARDESLSLPATLARLAEIKARWPSIRIRIHDDGSRDGTRDLLVAAGAWLEVSTSERPMGKVAALNRLAAASRADLLILMDANSLPAPDSIGRFDTCFRDPRIGAVGAVLTPQGEKGKSVAARYWRLEERIKRLESLTGSTMGCDGGLWAIRRDLMPVIEPGACDDFRASLEPLLRGYRVVSSPEIGVSEAADPDSACWTRMRRIGSGAWHVHRAIRPRLMALGPVDRFKYVSHKLLRWFSGLWLAGLVLSLVAFAWRTGFCAEVVILAAVGTALLVTARPLRRLRVGLTGLVAVTVGVARAMAGGAELVWRPSRDAAR